MPPCFRIPYVLAVIVAVALASITSVYSYLTAISIVAAKCRGESIVLGYRIGVWDWLAFPLFTAFVVVALVRSRRSRQLAELLANSDVTVFSFGSCRLTYGMFLAYVSLIGFVLFSALVTGISIARYSAISSFCSSSAPQDHGGPIQVHRSLLKVV